MSLDVRWEQRFQNFMLALALLRKAVEQDLNNLSDLAKEGAARRFDRALELAWKTLKDYLEYLGTSVKPVTPREITARCSRKLKSVPPANLRQNLSRGLFFCYPPDQIPRIDARGMAVAPRD